MGRSARNLKKKQKDKEEQAHKAVHAEIEERVRQQMSEGRYEKVIETVAELMQAGDVKAEFMYDAAYAYFMTGDYDRAANWVTNTLSTDAAHMDARILLGRLCVLQDRTDDGLAVFDFVLEHALSTLSDEKKDEIEEIVSFYGRSEMDKIVRNYPHVASFLKLDSKAEKPENKAAALLSRLREKVAQAGERAAAENGQKASAESPVKESEGKTASGKPEAILNTLRAKLAAIKESAGEKTAGTALPAEESIAAASAQERMTVHSAEAMLEQVEKQQAGALRKIEMLNSFAGGLYLERDLKGAERLLQEALKTDSASDFTLRNMALVQMELGDREKALKFASLMRQSDFLLLKALR